ncbi:hypothetical protein HELRODRAFT_161291 [Helobdella robusta]|uniref:Uncharacterized protein n=1 Tax=Helobdella robusta TaxID=6412 RepID=T1ERA8_HELRO|nr:hypothetical protein HELRODRAFT_161291 [Helobdella robusta]ESO02064.1 hypothetical protein HELRODRAFT_161291 [Helobdella robusta]
MADISTIQKCGYENTLRANNRALARALCKKKLELSELRRKFLILQNENQLLKFHCNENVSNDNCLYEEKSKVFQNTLNGEVVKLYKICQNLVSLSEECNIFCEGKGKISDGLASEQTKLPSDHLAALESMQMNGVLNNYDSIQNAPKAVLATDNRLDDLFSRLPAKPQRVQRMLETNGNMNDDIIDAPANCCNDAFEFDFMMCKKLSTITELSENDLTCIKDDEFLSKQGNLNESIVSPSQRITENLTSTYTSPTERNPLDLSSDVLHTENLSFVTEYSDKLSNGLRFSKNCAADNNFEIKYNIRSEGTICIDEENNQPLEKIKNNHYSCVSNKLENIKGGSTKVQSADSESNLKTIPYFASVSKERFAKHLDDKKLAGCLNENGRHLKDNHCSVTKRDILLNDLNVLNVIANPSKEYQSSCSNTKNYKNMVVETSDDENCPDLNELRRTHLFTEKLLISPLMKRKKSDECSTLKNGTSPEYPKAKKLSSLSPILQLVDVKSFLQVCESNVTCKGVQEIFSDQRIHESLNIKTTETDDHNSSQNLSHTSTDIESNILKCLENADVSNCPDSAQMYNHNNANKKINKRLSSVSTSSESRYSSNVLSNFLFFVKLSAIILENNVQLSKIAMNIETDCQKTSEQEEETNL